MTDIFRGQDPDPNEREVRIAQNIIPISEFNKLGKAFSELESIKVEQFNPRSLFTYILDNGLQIPRDKRIWSERENFDFFVVVSRQGLNEFMKMLDGENSKFFLGRIGDISVRISDEDILKGKELGIGMKGTPYLANKQGFIYKIFAQQKDHPYIIYPFDQSIFSHDLALNMLFLGYLAMENVDQAVSMVQPETPQSTRLQITYHSSTQTFDIEIFDRITYLGDDQLASEKDGLYRFWLNKRLKELGIEWEWNS